MKLYSSEHTRLDAEIDVQFGKSGEAHAGDPDQEGEAATSSSQQKQPAAKGRSCAEQLCQGVEGQEE